MANKEGHPINNLMDVTLQRIHEMADGNSVIGNPIHAADGTVVLPVSKVSYGFATGGSDVGAKAARDMFGGGSGAGVSVTPVAFLVIHPNGEVRLLQINSHANTLDRALEMMPDALNRLSALMTGAKKEEPAASVTEESANA